MLNNTDTPFVDIQPRQLCIEKGTTTKIQLPIQVWETTATHSTVQYLIMKSTQLHNPSLPPLLALHV